MAENQESINRVQEVIHDKLEAGAENQEEVGEKLIDDDFLCRWGAGVAIFSFVFLSVGSVLFGATPTTSFLRGIGGAILFGSVFWLVGAMFIQEGNPLEKVELKDK